MLQTWFTGSGALSPGQVIKVSRQLQDAYDSWASGECRVVPESLQVEVCFYVQTSRQLNDEELGKLEWLLQEETDSLSRNSTLESQSKGTRNVHVVEVGPRLTFCTPWCSNALEICQRIGIECIERMEKSLRFRWESEGDFNAESKAKSMFANGIHDRMTEMVYDKPLESSFTCGKEDHSPQRWHYVPVLTEGRKALEDLSCEMGLGFDEQDLDFYTDLFMNRLKRNPTSVECFDLSQSNSEHSRHWFFKGKMIIDGEELDCTLFDMIRNTLTVRKRSQVEDNSVIAFCDNSSAIRGGSVHSIFPSESHLPSPFISQEIDLDVTLTAETHNFPTGVAPFPGAATGTGGRIRDGHATGRGSLVIAGTAGYSVGALNIPGHDLPWERACKDWRYSNTLASPLQIIIEASNGASDYGNKFGEPVVAGFCRSYAMIDSDGSRKEYVKPIMFSGGIGQLQHRHLKKEAPVPGMLVVKLGGPAYRVGIGGGAASSVIQGTNAATLDFDAVQRGDAEVAQKVNRVIRACVELGERNPICSIHDQGAGGNANVLKEIVEPAGGEFQLRNLKVGDASLTVLEIWCAEYQENDALLVREGHAKLFSDICEREGTPFSIVGKVTGDGRIRLIDSMYNDCPVDFDLNDVLGEMPQKTFLGSRIRKDLHGILIPRDETVEDCLNLVLKSLNVGSKRFLTNKVDRSVTGLIAQQQCVGPLHIPLSDFAAIAQSHQDISGSATSIGEQPIKGLINSSSMARMCLAEMLTNIVWAGISGLEFIKVSVNWMWPAKFEDETAEMVDAMIALTSAMQALGVAADGGKDSLSMAAKVDGGELVKSPGTLVLSGYCTMPDIRVKVTPELKPVDQSSLLFIDLASGKHRLGGSVLAQVFNQIGDQAPDLEDFCLFKNVFNLIQELLREDILLAGHDRSDGGLLVCLLEMAFAGNLGILLCLNEELDPFSFLFNEELGLIIQVRNIHVDSVCSRMQKLGVNAVVIGAPLPNDVVRIEMNGEIVMQKPMTVLRDTWESTSFALEKLQANAECVIQEQFGLKLRRSPPYLAEFSVAAPVTRAIPSAPRIAIIREEGSNGDREMASAFLAAGFEPWDVSIRDLSSQTISLQSFKGIAFVGGFSYGDVLGSAKGWAAAIRFNSSVSAQFLAFYERKDTFSLGVCNGCQLMSFLGWVSTGKDHIRFVKNQSDRFESRFSTVRIEGDSPAVMLQGMEGAILGVWVAHGEGRLQFSSEVVANQIFESGCAPIRYVDDDGMPTEAYPFNPNGSPHGIAALCSADGRHLAMMPHPERCFLKWQWPYWTDSLPSQQDSSPWLRMFANAKYWVESQVDAGCCI